MLSGSSYLDGLEVTKLNRRKFMLMWGLCSEAEEILVVLVSVIYLCMLTWKFRDCS